MNATSRGGTVNDEKVAPDAHAGDIAPGDEQAHRGTHIETRVRGYLLGFVLAAVLTVRPSTSRAARWSGAGPTVALSCSRSRRWACTSSSSCT